MQLEIIYYRNKGFFKYLLFGKDIRVAVWLQSSGSYFCMFDGYFKNVKAYIFDKYFDVVEVQKLSLDYDAYVVAAQECMKKSGLKFKDLSYAELTGARQIYTVVYNCLSADRDYTHIKELTSKEINSLTPKKLNSYISSIINGLAT